MPTYAYACTACGHAFEIQQSFTDESLTVCPECQGRLRKVFSTVGVVFKGSGFYRTDSRNGSSAGSSTSGSSGASSSAAGSSGAPSAGVASTASSGAPSSSGAGASSGGGSSAATPAASA